MVSTLDFESSDPSSNLGGTSANCFRITLPNTELDLPNKQSYIFSGLGDALYCELCLLHGEDV